LPIYIGAILGATGAAVIVGVLYIVIMTKIDDDQFKQLKARRTAAAIQEAADRARVAEEQAEQQRAADREAVRLAEDRARGAARQREEAERPRREALARFDRLSKGEQKKVTDLMRSMELRISFMRLTPAEQRARRDVAKFFSGEAPGSQGLEFTPDEQQTIITHRMILEDGFDFRAAVVQLARHFPLLRSVVTNQGIGLDDPRAADILFACAMVLDGYTLPPA
jgi:hypothetical protein